MTHYIMVSLSSVIVLLAAAQSAAAAAMPAATASDICAATDDPCVIDRVYEVVGGSTLDFGPRAVEVVRGGQLRTDDIGMTIKAGSFRADPRARPLRSVGKRAGNVDGGLIDIVVDARCETDPQTVCTLDSQCGAGGVCDIDSAFVDIQSKVLVSGFDAGGLDVTAAGDITVGGNMNARSTSIVGSGGVIDLFSKRREISVTGKISARGGGQATGGDVYFDAEGDVTLTANIDVRGGDFDGGVLDVFAFGHTLIDARIRASATAGQGFGGQIVVESDAGITLGPKARIRTDGHSTEGIGGDAGGQDFFSYDGDIVFEQGSVIDARGARPDGYGEAIDVGAGGSAVLAGKVRVGARGAAGAGALIDVRADDSIVLTPTSSIRNRGLFGGRLTFDAKGDIDHAGRIELRSTGTLFDEVVLLSAGRNLTISGSIDMERNQDGGPGAPMLLNMSACSVTLEPTGALELHGEFGHSIMTVVSSVDIQAGARLVADSNTGSHDIITAVGTPAPTIDGTVVPKAIVTADPALDATGCSCGDGVLDGAEECDDGAANSDTLPDACRTTCENAACGDDVQDTGEACDDGDLIEGNGCDSNCTPTGCGNGIVTVGEECDDGAANSDIIPGACRTDCTLPICGDLVIDPLEECEDGNLISGDGCDANCTFTACGNGVITAGEQCDDGLGNSDIAPGACRTDCTLPFCGDSVVDPGEQCDLGAGNSDTLPDTCRLDCSLPSCGDAIIDSGEACDDGNAIIGDGCDPNCTASACGNGVLAPTEECDDGNVVSGDGCSDLCECESVFPCAGPGICPTSMDIVTLAPVGGVCVTNGDCVAGFCDPSLGRCATASQEDFGWTGISHGRDGVDGARLRISIDCGDQLPCGECTITGVDPEPRNCRCDNDVRQICDEPFSADADDCGGATCNCYLSPPQPTSSGNTPSCGVPRLSEDVTGTVNVDTGERSMTVRVRSVTSLGENLFVPCPYCAGDITVSDGVRNGTCVLGEFAGLACDVDAEARSFPAPGGDGSSLDCLPSFGKNISGTGLKQKLDQSTGTSSVGLGVACGFPPFIVENCHCGLCSDDATEACSSNADCVAGSCNRVGNLSPRPNQCNGGVCTDLGDGVGECPTGPNDMFCDGFARADGTGFIACLSNQDCSADIIGVVGGDCSLTYPRRCFAETISVTGLADPTLPIVGSLYCSPQTSGGGINTVMGLPGPARHVQQQLTTAYCSTGPDVVYTPGGSCP